MDREDMKAFGKEFAIGFVKGFVGSLVVVGGLTAIYLVGVSVGINVSQEALGVTKEAMDEALKAYNKS